MTMRKKGFTLIELLVVISIIAILAAIIMPVYSRIKELGRQTQCISNLHFIGQAVVMYRDDQKNFPPFDYAAKEPGLQALVATEYLEKVQGSPKAIMCPDDSIAGSLDSYDTFNNMVLYNYAGYGAKPAAWDGYSDPSKTAPDETDGKLRYLMNRNCPGDTIVTHCAHHRVFYGANKSAWLDMVLFLNGSTEKANTSQMFPAVPFP